MYTVLTHTAPDGYTAVPCPRLSKLDEPGNPLILAEMRALPPNSVTISTDQRCGKKLMIG